MESVYPARLERFEQQLSEAGIERAVVTAPANLRYLTGVALLPVERFCGLFVAPGEPATLVVPEVDAPLAADNTALIEVISWSDADGPDAAIGSTETARSARFGCEREQLTLAVAGLLRIDLADTADVSGILASLRARKDERELDCIRRAARVMDATMNKVRTKLEAGLSEKRIAMEVRVSALECGSEELAYQPIALVGENAANPHGAPGERVLRSGDTVLVDFESVVEGYVADCTRNFVIGEPSETLSEIHAVVKLAAAAGRDACRPGVTCGEVDGAARDVIEHAGFGASFLHRTGHGLGLDVHERPFLVAGSPEALEVGNVVTVEPGVYVPEVGGVRIEDVVAVHDRGREVMTTTSRAFESAGS